MLIKLFKKTKKLILYILLRPEIGYRFFLKIKYGVTKPLKLPKESFENKVLGNKKEWAYAYEQVNSLGLPPCSDKAKNWDSLAALSCILKKTDQNARILDAGAELYSMVLPWLFLYGYRQLIGINTVFNFGRKRGPILYKHGNITNTNFRDNSFDAISCLSVIEHGLDIRMYFKEMSRILKPNGILVTSADYYELPIDTKNQMAYGAPIYIFSKKDILETLEIAKEFGLVLTGPLDLHCQEKAVRWENYDLDYTFIFFTLQKKADKLLVENK